MNIVQYDVAAELGFSKSLIKYVLEKNKFESAGDLVEYLMDNEDKISVKDDDGDDDDDNDDDDDDEYDDDEEEEDPDESNDDEDPDETDLGNSGGLLELPG